MGKRLVYLLVTCVVGGGLYFYARGDASERVKKTMLEGIELMEIKAADKDYVRGLVTEAHPTAFDKALHTLNNEGHKFDAHLYYNEIKKGVVERAKKAGRTELADQLELEFSELKFDVEER